MISIDEIARNYPLHWCVWNDNYQELQILLKSEKLDPEKLDSRGRTPLMLAVKLSHLQSVKELLAAKCNANAEHNGWSVVQEAICSGDANILTAILEVRDLQRHIQRVTHVPKLLQKLVDAPDFYVEMKWEIGITGITSWIPLMSRLCPSDTYKVYKRGSNVRIDTTLIGFDKNTWQRGNRSYIFKGQDETATMIEIDHDANEVSIEQLRGLVGDIHGIPPSRESVNARLNAQVTSTNIDMDKISFERNKSGIWGWRSDKMETINGYECKVYAASNVELVTRTRMDHLNEQQARVNNSRTPLQNLLGIAEEEVKPLDESPVDPENAASNSTLLDASPTSTVSAPLTPEEYFSDCELNGRDIGQPKKLSNKVQRFKANLWLSEDFPIKLQEQVLPILDLMSTMASPHVSKLKDFITMQLPAGFPIRVEIPLFHILNACVTFGNVFALETPVPNVEQIREDNDERLACVIDDSCFDIPSHYINRGADYRRQMTFDDEDDLLQYAIQQSLMETGSEMDQVDIWEALKGQRPLSPANFNQEEAQIQRALHESLCGMQSSPFGLVDSPTFDIDPDLALAIRISEEEQKKFQEDLRNEQEMFERALKLSLEESGSTSNATFDQQ